MVAEEKNIKRFLLIRIVIPFAIEFIVYNFRINQLFGIPVYVYTGIIIVIGSWILYQILVFLRYLIIKSRDHKQYQYQYNKSVGYLQTNYPKFYYDYDKFNWLIYIEPSVKPRGFTPYPDGDSIQIHFILGPLCPENSCKTELNSYKTFLAKYKYYCPSCDMRTISKKNEATLEVNVEKTLRSVLRKDGLNDFEFINKK